MVDRLYKIAVDASFVSSFFFIRAIIVTLMLIECTFSMSKKTRDCYKWQILNKTKMDAMTIVILRTLYSTLRPIILQTKGTITMFLVVPVVIQCLSCIRVFDEPQKKKMFSTSRSSLANNCRHKMG